MASPLISGTHHIAVQIRDLAAAEAFYVGVLGLRVLKRWPSEAGGDRSLWLDLRDGSFLALERADPSAPPPSRQEFYDGHAGWHLVALKIAPSERGGWLQHLEQHGVPIVRQSRWTLYVRDPDGNRIGLSHYPDDAP